MVSTRPKQQPETSAGKKPAWQSSAVFMIIFLVVLAVIGLSIVAGLRLLFQ